MPSTSKIKRPSAVDRRAGVRRFGGARVCRLAFAVTLLALGLACPLDRAQAEDEVREWTNAKGQVIKAAFVSATERTVTIKVEGIKSSFTIKLVDLSFQSQNLPKELESARQVEIKRKLAEKRAQEALEKAERDRRVVQKAKHEQKIKNALLVAINETRTSLREGVRYPSSNPFTPYTGWMKAIRDGLPRNLYHFKNGKRDGPFFEWYQHNRKMTEGQYKEGQLHSISTWKPNGEKCPYTKVMNGAGVFVSYHENGRKKTKGYYKDGKKDGEWTIWRETGQRKWRGHYKQDHLVDQ